MTSPAGGNDDVVRYVFQAVADYGQLLRETRRAREETRALKADIDGLAGTTTARVKVTADTGQARTELGRVLQDVAVKIKVTVDAAAANAELQRLLRDATVKAKLVVDAVAARAEIARATRDATVRVRLYPDTTDFIAVLGGLLRDRAVQIAVALDEHGVTERFRALLAHLESMGPVTIRVDLHEGILDRIEAAADRLRRLRDDVQGGGGGPGPEPRPDPGPRPGGGSGSGSGPIPPGLSSAASTVAGWGSLIAAAVPVAAALAAGVGTIAASFAAAGAGAGIFAVAAVGAVQDVADAVKAYEKTGAVALGPLGQVVDEFERLKTQYGQLQDATQGDVMPVFVHGLQIAEHVLTVVEPLIARFARSIDEALSQVDEKVTGGGLQGFLDFVGREGPHAIEAFTTGLLAFTGGLGNLIMQFAPFVRAFVDGFAQAGEAFDRWSAGLGDNASFQRFLDYAVDAIPQVIELVTNLFAAAGNVAAALAPLGSMLLSIANAALKFIAALPTGALTVILGGILGVAAAIKALQLAIAVSEGYSKFVEFLSILPGRLGAVVAGLGAMRVAMIALGAATAIGLVLGAIALAMSAVTSQTEKNAEADRRAADAADTHRRAVQNLTDALRANNGVIGDNERVAAYEDLDKDPVKLPDKYKDSRLVDPTKIKTVAGYATEAGVAAPQLADARLGDAAALDKTDASLAKLQARYKALGDAASLLPKGDPRHLQAAQYYAEADAIGASRDQMTSYGGIMEEAQAKFKILNELTGQGAQSQKQYADGLANATSALDAYQQQQKAVADAEQAAKDALYQSRQAQLAVNEARLQAVQRIKDVQRALRDLTLDERQANLNVKEADQNLAKLLASGGTTDQIEQARIDDERAHNALNDLQQDKGPKRAALNKELAAGVDGNKQLLAAIHQNESAQRALKTANTNLGTASKKLADLHLAFLSASAAVGLSEGQITKLKTNMDKLKDKTVKIVADTSDAEEKLRRLAQYQIAIALLQQSGNVGMDFNTAWTQAGKQMAQATAKAHEDANSKAVKNREDYPKGSTGYAEGGPTVASAVTAGAVYGPGTGTSDNIAVRLPVGGPALVSPGEHIATDAEVRAAPGGHAYFEAFRAGLRAGRPWGPPAQRGYAAGGAAAPSARAGWAPGFAMPSLALAAALPGYAAGGAVAAATAGGTVINRSVSISGVTITNAVPETASTSLYRMVRRAVDGEVA